MIFQEADKLPHKYERQKQINTNCQYEGLVARGEEKWFWLIFCHRTRDTVVNLMWHPPTQSTAWHTHYVQPEFHVEPEMVMFFRTHVVRLFSRLKVDSHPSTYRKYIVRLLGEYGKLPKPGYGYDTFVHLRTKDIYKKIRKDERLDEVTMEDMM